MILFRRGLYLITDERLLPRGRFLARVRQALSRGVDLVQLREKRTGKRDRAGVGRALVALAHRYGARVVVNDDPWLAAELGADGVHLGEKDPPVAAARELLGREAVIGVSCYGDLRRAARMQALGADYVSFGAFHPSPTKPEEPLVDAAALGEARRLLRVPVVAIGGIGPGNAAPLLEAGADALAVVSSVFAARDAGEAVRTLGGAVRRHRRSA